MKKLKKRQYSYVLTLLVVFGLFSAYGLFFSYISISIHLILCFTIENHLKLKMRLLE